MGNNETGGNRKTDMTDGYEWANICLRCGSTATYHNTRETHFYDFNVAGKYDILEVETNPYDDAPEDVCSECDSGDDVYEIENKFTLEEINKIKEMKGRERLIFIAEKLNDDEMIGKIWDLHFGDIERPDNLKEAIKLMKEMLVEKEI